MSDATASGEPTNNLPKPIEEQAPLELPTPTVNGGQQQVSGAPSPALPQNSQPLAPALPATPPPLSTTQNATPQHSAISPTAADDADLIEKEWVDRAKAIVEKTRDNPHEQNKEINKYKADYVKKRYNKDLKVSED